ncbi:hypothetical protein ASE63_02235 [Bosea sp. Root381]|uniref:hypothetical protein n=1 Tax=Bosea sp. Root381 TaxID=1736524 RepID=UPI0006F5D177|nr:hypothetical protein [Bosea sp. Root381]KRE18026.1 hypothetical protein ASE63_02235 [Bosea sp. Root381]
MTLLDNGQTVIRHLRNPARTRDTLVVTFAEMLMNDPSAAGFGEKFFLKAGYDLVIVQKRSESWYQDLKVAEFRDSVSGIAAQYRDVACYGISMGAFAALYFGGSIDASILALSPLCSIHPRFPQLGAQEYRAQLTATQCDLADAPKSEKPVFIVFDPRVHLDALYMREEIIPAFPDATIALAPGAGHPVSRCLNGMGLLGPLVLDFVQDRRTPNIAAALRPKRANSPFWLANLADRCARRSRFDTALSLCDKAIGLASDPAFFAAKRDAVVRRQAVALAQ